MGRIPNKCANWRIQREIAIKSRSLRVFSSDRFKFNFHPLDGWHMGTIMSACTQMQFWLWNSCKGSTKLKYQGSNLQSSEDQPSTSSYNHCPLIPIVLFGKEILCKRLYKTSRKRSNTITYKFQKLTLSTLWIFEIDTHSCTCSRWWLRFEKWD